MDMETLLLKRKKGLCPIVSVHDRGEESLSSSIVMDCNFNDCFWTATFCTASAAEEWTEQLYDFLSHISNNVEADGIVP
ncbi:unnamed protein product [Brugia pahangi]|uniref:PH domain-containing protein n=1 Tax=Brugia pahangi TaxID=6280 RepID=A0A0N4T1U7_BRUPA|nr:unnamed protein product [Brugia pahangi]